MGHEQVSLRTSILSVLLFKLRLSFYNRRVGVGVSVGVGVGGSVGVSVYFLHSLYTKAFQKDWGGSFQKLYEHAAQG